MKKVEEILISQISPNRSQPRLSFYDDSLNELAQSIKENGLIQPIIVRAIANEKYEIIAGERRYRAFKKLAKATIPAIVLNKSADESADLALIENIQREGLSAIEEAKAIEHILKTRKMTQSKLAKRLGYQQSTLANKLRLLKLPTSIKEEIANKKLSERHARALLKLETSEQLEVTKLILDKSLTVKETEDYINKYLNRHEKHNKGVTANIKIGINTIKQAYELCSKSGLDVSFNMVEYDNDIKLVIRFRK